MDNFFSHILMPISIAFIMFGIGINLNFAEFKNTFRKPKAVITGLVAQMLMLPAIAFVINLFLDIDPIYKVGLIVIAACPGGTTSNIVTLFLKGRLALSVTLTAFNSFLILFTIPLVTNLALSLYEGLETNIQLPVLETVGNMILTVLAPVLVGMLYNFYFPVFASRSKKAVNISMLMFLLFVFIGIFVFEKIGRARLSDYLFLLIPTLSLNIFSTFAGFLLARIAGIRNRGRFTIAIQVGLQNSALAIYVAAKLLSQPEMAVVAIIYSSFSLFTTSLWAFIMKKYL